MTADSFKAIDVGYAVQRSFANKFFANKTIAKGLIDENSAQLLDELYKLAKIYVSSQRQNSDSNVFKSHISTIRAKTKRMPRRSSRTR